MMNLDKSKSTTLYELISADKKTTYLVSKKRMLIGNSEAAEIRIASPYVSGIHAILEIKESESKLYDMNSTNGTLVNGQPIVVSTINLGDSITFADQHFTLALYKPEDLVPPVLDILEPKISAPPIIKMNPELPSLAVKSVPVSQKEDSPIYPLAKDPKADYLEYIFEDAAHLYPIFHYQVEKSSVEVIVLFQGRIISVDYLPAIDGMYKIAGSHEHKDAVIYPALAKTEEIPFVQIKGEDVYLTQIDGHQSMLYTDGGVKQHHDKLLLLDNDMIARFVKGDIQIFVKLTDAPPIVDVAPVMRRDPLYQKLLLSSLAIVILFMIALSSYTIDPTLDEDKKPERIAEILYKVEKKPTPIPPKPMVVDHTPKENPKKIQKAPTKVDLKSEQEKVITKSAPAKQSKQKGTKSESSIVKNESKSPAPNVSNKKSAARVTESSTPTATPTPSKGHVDTYKAIEFESTMSSLLSKSGATKNLQVSAATATDLKAGGIDTGSQSSSIERAAVSSKIGSLQGVARGSLDNQKGIEGLVSKKSIITIGVPSETVVLGAMDPDIIRKILMDHLSQFRHCYQKELDRAASVFDGALPLAFTIGPSGSVTEAGLDGSTVVPADVKACVVNVLQGIKFPEPRGGGRVSVKQPMNFQAQVR